MAKLVENITQAVMRDPRTWAAIQRQAALVEAWEDADHSYATFMEDFMRAIAASLGVTYEEMMMPWPPRAATEGGGL